MTKRPFRIHFEFCVHADMLFSVKTFSQQTCLWEHTCDDWNLKNFEKTLNFHLTHTIQKF